MGTLTFVATFDVALPSHSDWEDAEFRLPLWGAGFSHGYLSFGAPPKGWPQQEIGVAEAGSTDQTSIWMRLDWSTREDATPVSGPGLRSLLMMADALRLLGASDPTRVRLETRSSSGDVWPLPGPHAEQERMSRLSEQADRWASPHVTFPWHVHALTPQLIGRDVAEIFGHLLPLSEIWPRQWQGGLPEIDHAGTLTMQLADDLPAFGWLYDALTVIGGAPPPMIEGIWGG